MFKPKISLIQTLLAYRHWNALLHQVYISRTLFTRYTVCTIWYVSRTIKCASHTVKYVSHTIRYVSHAIRYVSYTIRNVFNTIQYASYMIRYGLYVLNTFYTIRYGLYIFWKRFMRFDTVYALVCKTVKCKHIIIICSSIIIFYFHYLIKPKTIRVLCSRKW